MRQTASPQSSTPVLFLIFNRPDTTEKVFQQIRAARPARLFVSADGPRKNKDGERQRCEEARKIIGMVDWKCELKTRFSDDNLGCRVAVSSAIDWFFDYVEEGIILEDDCLPDSSFFPFCEALLAKYRDDQRIMHIGGTNFQDGRVRGNGSYYFSRITHIWGWATWRRAWEKYDVTVSTFDEFIVNNRIADIFPERRTQKYLLRDFHQVHANKKDTWDIQWTYCTMVNNGLAIIPNQNLVSNIGFGIHASHTTLHDPLANRPTGAAGALVHPRFVIPNREADLYTFRKYKHLSKFQKFLRLASSILHSGNY